MPEQLFVKPEKPHLFVKPGHENCHRNCFLTFSFILFVLSIIFTFLSLFIRNTYPCDDENNVCHYGGTCVNGQCQCTQYASHPYCNPLNSTAMPFSFFGMLALVLWTLWFVLYCGYSFQTSEYKEFQSEMREFKQECENRFHALEEPSSQKSS